MFKRDGAEQGKRLCKFMLSFLLIASLLPVVPLQNAVANDSIPTDPANKIVLLENREYVSGEVLAVVSEDTSSSAIHVLSSSPLDSAEVLMTLDEAAYEEAMTGESTEAQTSNGVTTLSTQENITIKRVSSSELTTEELLGALALDPRVLLVQPNYIYQSDAGSNTMGTTEDTVSTQALLDPSHTNDLTNYQWGNSNTSEYVITAEKLAGFDINPPDWDTDRTIGGSTNATGAIAIVDTGIDYTHPDLTNVMANGLDTLIGYGGSNGYCAVDGLDPTEPMDLHGQGTHCAGIAAAEWNTFGVSGVASGVEVIAVRAANDAGQFSDAWVIKGYEYLADAINSGIELKAINNSWGGSGASAAFSVAVAKLGNLGAISVIASGDEAKDLDAYANTSASLHLNPYCVIVNSATMSGAASSFSNYGSVSSHSYAPGSGILSTYPQSLAKYLPEAVKAVSGNNVVYESFSTGFGGKVRTFSSDNAALGTEIGTQNTSSYFDNDAGTMSSMRIPTSNLNDDVISAHSKQYASKYMYAFIDVNLSQQADVSYLGFHASAEGAPAGWRGNTRVLFECVDGASGTDTRWEYGMIMEGSDWTLTSIDIESLLSANEQLVFTSGDRLRVRIDFFSLEGSLSDVNAFNIDAFGLGDSNSTVPYQYESGTSMAASFATGAAAVIALSDSATSPSEQALERAARLKGSVSPMNSFANLCASGGALDLSKHISGDYTPVLNSVDVVKNSNNEYELTLQGYFFEASPGTLTISGNTMQVINWSDTQVRVVYPPTMQSGYHVIQVSNSKGYTGQNAFIIDLSEPANPPHNGPVLAQTSDATLGLLAVVSVLCMAALASLLAAQRRCKTK